MPAGPIPTGNSQEKDVLGTNRKSCASGVVYLGLLRPTQAKEYSQ